MFGICWIKKILGAKNPVYITPIQREGLENGKRLNRKIASVSDLEHELDGVLVGIALSLRPIGAVFQQPSKHSDIARRMGSWQPLRPTGEQVEMPEFVMGRFV